MTLAATIAKRLFGEVTIAAGSKRCNRLRRGHRTHDSAWTAEVADEYGQTRRAASCIDDAALGEDDAAEGLL